MSLAVQTLHLQGFRNFSHQEFEFDPQCNLIWGPNGAGKTSVLEALYFLSAGRSFRTKQLDRIIHQGQDEFILFAELCHDQKSHKLGVSRHRQQPAQQKINGEYAANATEFAYLLPVLMLGPESFRLFTEGAKVRRQWLDWGVFYADVQYIQHWRKAKRLLEQRNAALKQKARYEYIALWDQALVENSQVITRQREYYVKRWQAQLERLDADFLDQHQLKMQYYQGWSDEQELATLLQNHYEQDLKQGFTSMGPQRADVRFRIGRASAQEILSRGQQKRLICLLKLAQGLLYQEDMQQACVYLIDDLGSELDDTNQRLLLKQVFAQQAQAFLTSTNAFDLLDELLPSLKRFPLNPDLNDS